MAKDLGLDKDGQKKHLRPVDYLTDSLGQFALNANGQLTGQLTYFYTTKMGMASTTVGTVLLISKIFDAVSDLFMGKLVDKTNTKAGKARPWLLRMTIPAFLACVLLFTVPPSMGNFRYVYALITSVFASAIVYTAIAVPYYAMMSFKTRSSEEKGKMGTFRAAVGYAIGVFCGIGLIPITTALGDDQRAWIIFGGILGVLSAICLLITYMFSREIYHDEGEMAQKEASISIIEGLKILIKNKYWIVITLVGVAMNLVYGIALIAPLYYGAILLDDPEFYSIVNTVNIFPSVLGFLTVSFWIKRFGLTGTAKWASVIGIAGCLIRTIVPMNSYVFLAANCLVMYATIPLISVLPAMTLNTAELNMQTSGVRITGMTNASNSFVGKLGGSVGGSLIGWVLGAGGFDAFNAGEMEGVTVGLQQAVFTINNYIPLAMFVIIFLLLFRYKYEELLPEILRKNEDLEKGTAK
ncbi:MAG: MFS transporter [Agathobacter sp.]|nr:MFS transporter [Agathobacter sp.]